MKTAFLGTNLSLPSRATIAQANTIITTYQAQGYTLSLRQLYYQFVSRNWLTNTEQSYKRLGSIINDGRLAGFIDWTAIVDRGRETIIPPHWTSPKDILEASANSFAINKWADQPNHVEIMVEKQALEGVLVPVCQELDVPFTANKGYSSASALYEASRRMKRAANADKTVHILYLGDHDPSGIDMTRDITDRLGLFIGVRWYDRDDKRIYIDPTMEDRLAIHRLALNMDQIDEYEPPPNPAKLTDSRATGYIQEFGDTSWELDALEPAVLAALVEDAITELRNDELWDDAIARESEMRRYLQQVADDYQQPSPSP